MLIAAFSLWCRDQAYYDAAPGRGRHLSSDGGAVLNQAVHYVDLMLWLFGPADSVSCHTATLTHEIAAEDCAILSMSFASGALGTLVTSTSVLAEAERLEVRCEHGSIVLAGGSVTRAEWLPELQIEPPPSVERAKLGAGDRLEPFRRQHRDFARAIAASGPPTVTATEALGVVELIRAAYRSAASGERCRLSRGPA